MNEQELFLHSQIDPQEVIELTQRLVTIPSENPPGNEEPIAQLLGEYLLSAGFQVQFHQLAPGRLNLLAARHGEDPGPTLLYCGHSDTTPLFGEWTLDPHGGSIIEKKLYGRGAADMKGGLAAMAVAGAALSRDRLLQQGSLLIAAVIDEENQGQGACQLVTDLQAAGIQPDWAVIGEPTENTPVIVSNGQVNLTFTLRGVAGHGSTPSSGHNAIYDGVLLVQALCRLAEEEFPHRSHPLVGAPSLNVGTFHGGVQTSVIPDTCQISVDRRLVPGETPSEVIAEMEELLHTLQRNNPGFAAQMQVTYSLPPVTVAENSPVVQVLRRVTGAICGRDPGLAGIRATTDAATLACQGGIPTVIFGPGSIAQAHKPDEYIQLNELVDAARIFAYTAYELLHSPFFGVREK